MVPSVENYWVEVVRGIRSQAEALGLAVDLRVSSYDSVDERPMLQALAAVPGIIRLLIAPKTTGKPAVGLDDWLGNKKLHIETILSRILDEGVTGLLVHSDY